MLENLKARLYEKLHHQPYGTEEIVHMSEIKIPYKFKKNYAKPKEWKMERARSYYNQHGHIDKPLSVRMIAKRDGTIRYLLKDEYTRYLILREVHSGAAPVIFI
jgi:hypothetical protein